VYQNTHPQHCPSTPTEHPVPSTASQPSTLQIHQPSLTTTPPTPHPSSNDPCTYAICRLPLPKSPNFCTHLWHYSALGGHFCPPRSSLSSSLVKSIPLLKRWPCGAERARHLARLSVLDPDGGTERARELGRLSSLTPVRAPKKLGRCTGQKCRKGATEM